MEKGKAVKTSVYLPQEAIDSLKKIAEEHGTTMAQVLRQAISTQAYLDEQVKDGGEVLVKKGKDVKQVVFF